MNTKQMILGLLMATGTSACGIKKSADNVAIKYSEVDTANKIEFTVLSENMVRVYRSHDPITPYNENSRSIYLLADSAVVTIYNPGTNASTGGDKRFWRNNEFDTQEKEEFIKAAQLAKLKFGK